jgi:hypothetical protein
MSQPNSQSSTAESVESVQFTTGMRPDKPFRFTERRAPVVKVIRKSRAKSPVSTRRDVQLSKSELQPPRKPGRHYRGERHTDSRAVPAGPSGTDHMPNARTSQRPKSDTQPPRLRSLGSKPLPPSLESQLSMLPSQLSQSSSQLPPLSEQLPANPSPTVATNPGVHVQQFRTDDEIAICRLAQNQVF